MWTCSTKYWCFLTTCRGEKSQSGRWSLTSNSCLASPVSYIPDLFQSPDSFSLLFKCFFDSAHRAICLFFRLPLPLAFCRPLCPRHHTGSGRRIAADCFVCGRGLATCAHEHSSCAPQCLPLSLSIARGFSSALAVLFPSSPIHDSLFLYQSIYLSLSLYSLLLSQFLSLSFPVYFQLSIFAADPFEKFFFQTTPSSFRCSHFIFTCKSFVRVCTCMFYGCITMCNYVNVSP